MIVTVFISSDIEEENDYSIIFRRIDNEKIEFHIQDESGKEILKECYFAYEELKRAILGLEYKE